MSIDLYTGTPGSGKSLHLAREIFDYCSLPKNRLIIANFDVVKDNLKHPERFMYMDNKDLTPQHLMNIGIDRVNLWKNYSELENSIVLIIDECQLLFNARSWNATGRDEWVKFFTQHRKLGYKIILVAQFDLMIDKQIRSLIDVQYLHRKLSDLGLFCKFLKIITRSDLFVAIEIFYPLNCKLSSRLFRAHKKYYSLYDTLNLFSEFNVDNN